MVLDDRIVAAAPGCYLTNLRRLMETIGAQDAEQNIHAQIAFGMDHADYVLARAPQPTLIMTATRDFFDIAGSWAAFRQAKCWYGRLGLRRARGFAPRSTTGTAFPARCGRPRPAG